ncbi:polysaccharide pyruvyl transferase family protein [Isoptericola sp. NPDC056605]|uniref:polysaccharide pyruvyl transferase family protein n=1 Tax=Isoptericola sp. NPDC056605 TaxID=3345876 RepID=UPI00368529C0
MDYYPRVGLIDNLQNPHELILREGYEAPVDRYMAAVGGNTGNLAFVHGAHKIIGPKLTRVGWGWSVEAVRDVADVIVISCANQIGAHADLGGWADALERFGLPVVLLGLGAQTPNYEAGMEIPEGTRRFLQIVEKFRPAEASNTGVRGTFTQEVLAGLGSESVPLGCPSLFISPDVKLGASIAKRSGSREIGRVAVAAGNPFHLGNRAVEKQMIALCEEYDGAYVVQHPDSIVGLALDGARLDVEKTTVIGELLGFSSAAECAEWFRRNSYSFHESQTWMHALRHYDAVVGARYHGVAFGVQIGIPGRVLHIDNRTKELATTTGIPSTAVEDIVGMTSDEIVGLLPWDDAAGREFDANRQSKAQAMIDFLTANGLEPSAQLRAIAAASAGAEERTTA